MKLKDIGNYFIGLTYKPEDVSDTGIIVLRSGNIQDNKICFDDVVRVDKQIPERLFVKAGDILMCSRNGSARLVGKSAVIPETVENMTFGAFMTVFRTPVNEYLQYFFLSQAFRRQLTTGKTTTINQITISMLDNIEINMPDSATMIERCKKLHAVLNIIDHRKRELSVLDTLVKVRFMEIIQTAELSDETTIEAITKRVKVGFVGPCERYYTNNSGIPMLRTGNITDKGIVLKDLKYVTAEFHEKNKKSQIHTGDLLIARHGTNGQANVYEGPEAQCLNAVVIVPNLEIASSVFLASLINSPMIRAQINQTLVGTTQNVINTKSIAMLKVRIPALSIQKNFESFVTQIDKTKSVIQSALAKAQLLFNSLMQQYFG